MPKFLRTLALIAWLGAIGTVAYGFATGRLYVLLQVVTVFHEPAGPAQPDGMLRH